jgi:protocatechuate 3,4-dioxygenase beta subunit
MKEAMYYTGRKLKTKSLKGFPAHIEFWVSSDKTTTILRRKVLLPYDKDIKKDKNFNLIRVFNFSKGKVILIQQEITMNPNNMIDTVNLILTVLEENKLIELIKGT